MPIDWSATCVFIFAKWKTESAGMFVLGCLLTLLVGVGVTAAKERGWKEMASRGVVARAGYYSLLCFNSVVFMALMMTMNGFVNLSLLAGLTLGNLLPLRQGPERSALLASREEDSLAM